MPDSDQIVPTQCGNCGGPLALGALACPACHALVRAGELEALTRQARELESTDPPQARELWNRALALLPHDSKQAAWVRGRIQMLEAARGSDGEPAGPSHAWARRFGPLAPILILLAKGKTIFLAIFKLKFLFGFFSSLWLYVVLYGWRFGVGLLLSIFIHELGHFVDIRRRGFKAELPMFVPGFGAYVRWGAGGGMDGMAGVTRRQRAQIGMAGPLAGGLAAAACLWL
ncbi:MAG: site-2 protease family protein, partial [Terracidiphilus sp.]